LALGGSNLLAHLVVWWVDHFPDALPALMDSALNVTEDREVVMPCAEALNFGPPNHLRVSASACGIAFTDLVPALEYVCEFAEKAREAKQYITSPIGFRFTAPGIAWLAPQYDRDSCMIELPMLQGTPEATDTLDEFIRSMAIRFGARPHWGQRTVLEASDFAALYPKLGEFQEVARELGGAGLYSNAFVRRLGLP
jgi:hypothetical protein